MTTALCPGSFDPPTNGHVDVISRAIDAFDRVIVAVVDNPAKQALFDVEDRVAMLESLFGDRATVDSFHGLLVEYSREARVDVVVKGLRKVDGSYDIVYIDGWHSAFGAMADGVMSWPLLKVGGVMIFDDYLWVPPKLGPPPRLGLWERKLLKWRGQSRKDAARLRQIESVATETPKLGVDSLLATLAGDYELLGISNQLAVRKIREFDQGQLGHDT